MRPIEDAQSPTAKRTPRYNGNARLAPRHIPVIAMPTCAHITVERHTTKASPTKQAICNRGSRPPVAVALRVGEFVVSAHGFQRSHTYRDARRCPASDAADRDHRRRASFPPRHRVGSFGVVGRATMLWPATRSTIGPWSLRRTQMPPIDRGVGWCGACTSIDCAFWELPRTNSLSWPDCRGSHRHTGCSSSIIACFTSACAASLEWPGP